MNISRLSTLSLALAIVVLTLGYVNPSFAGKKCQEDPSHPSCKPPADEGNTYTAELRGAFVFGPLEVTLEGQNERFTADVDIVMTREDSTARATWDNVFSMPDPEPCDLFGIPGAVESFTAFKKEKPEKGWRIALPGGVYALFFGELPTAMDSAAEGRTVRVSLALWGNCEYSGGTDPCDPFLPDPATSYGHGNGISEIPLLTYQIHAKARKGEPQFEGCHDASNELFVPSTLVITATAP